MNGIHSRAPLIIAFSLVLITCSACGEPQETSPGASATPSADPTPGSTTTPASAPAIIDMTRNSPPTADDGSMTPQQQIAHAQADLTTRLGLNPADVRVLSSGPVTWRSGAIGCPKPGMNYTQALVPGFQIILQAGQTTHHYHAESGGQPFYCPADRTEPPSQDRAYE